MSYELTGTVKLKGETQTFPSGFCKQELVVTTGDKYPQDIKIEFAKDQVALLANVGVMDEVSVLFNVRGNEYNGNHYVNLSGYRISVTKKCEDGIKYEPAPAPALQAVEDEGEIPF